MVLDAKRDAAFRFTASCNGASLLGSETIWRSRQFSLPKSYRVHVRKLISPQHIEPSPAISHIVSVHLRSRPRIRFSDGRRDLHGIPSRTANLRISTRLLDSMPTRQFG